MVVVSFRSDAAAGEFGTGDQAHRTGAHDQHLGVAVLMLAP